MAATDPKIGAKDDFNGLTITAASETESPLLYHGRHSYYSQIARLVLVEKGCAWRSRHMDHRSAMEQLQPFYLAMSPTGTVPLLLPGGGAPGSSNPITDSRDIMHYVDASLPGPALMPQDNPTLQERAERLIAAHYAFEVEDLTFGHMLMGSMMLRMVVPRKVAGMVQQLRRLEQDKKQPQQVREAAARKVQQQEARLVKFKDPAGSMWGPAKAAALALLDNLERDLQAGAGPWVCGEQYTLADVVMTAFLARLCWLGPLVKELEARPAVVAYWQRIQARPSFEAAAICKDPPAKLVG